MATLSPPSRTSQKEQRRSNSPSERSSRTNGRTFSSKARTTKKKGGKPKNEPNQRTIERQKSKQRTNQTFPNPRQSSNRHRQVRCLARGALAPRFINRERGGKRFIRKETNRKIDVPRTPRYDEHDTRPSKRVPLPTSATSLGEQTLNP